MKTSLTIAALLIYCSIAFCQLNIDQTNKTFIIDFNDFNGSGFCPIPAAGQLSSNTWSIKGLSDGNLNFGDTKVTAATDFTRGIHNGLAGTGGVYAFNTGNNIILGVQPIGSDFTPGSFTLKLHNTTPDTIKSLFISYDIFSMNDQGRGNSLNFSFSTDSINYVTIAALDFITSDVANGNPVWEEINKNILLSGITISPTANFYFRWNGDDVNGTGNRDEYGIDNISVTANPLPVTAAFTTENVCFGNDVHFTNESVSVIDSIISTRWNFGDAVIDSTENPIHNYTLPGTYSVQLIVGVSQGNEDTTHQNVTVYPRPKAQFASSNTSGCLPFQISFTDSSTVTSGNIFSHSWNFSDPISGLSNTDTASNSSHLFEREGAFSCQLVVVSDFGCADSSSVVITANPIPVSNFGYSVSGTSVSFIDSSLITSGNLNYSWNFGDGDTSSSTNPNHNYISSGTYTVCLSVQSTGGCIDSTFQTITVTSVGVTEIKSKNNFRFYPNPVNDGVLNIDLDNNSNGEVLITNMLGQVVLQKSIDDPNSTTLDLTGILPGSYMITLITENNKETSQLIVQ